MTTELKVMQRVKHLDRALEGHVTQRRMDVGGTEYRVLWDNWAHPVWYHSREIAPVQQPPWPKGT